MPSTEKKAAKNDTVITHNDKNDAAGTIAQLLKDRAKNRSIHFRVYPNMLMKSDISELELTQRAFHCLMRNGYKTVGQLADEIEGTSDLMRFRGAGKKTAQEIMYKLYLFQYTQLNPEKQQAYLEEVIELNCMDK